MKFFVVFVALFCAALAAPPLGAQPQRLASGDVQILRQESQVRPDGYSYSWETSDGSSASESGQLRDIGSENPSLGATGSFSFVAPDGQSYSVQYTADENGFQPTGIHLPH